MDHKEQVVKYYLFPLDEFAHKALKEVLPKKAFKKEIECVDRRRRDMWECCFFFSNLFQNPQKVGFKFHLLNVVVYEKMASDGRVRMKKIPDTFTNDLDHDPDPNSEVKLPDDRPMTPIPKLIKKSV